MTIDFSAIQPIGLDIKNTDVSSMQTIQPQADEKSVDLFQKAMERPTQNATDGHTMAGGAIRLASLTADGTASFVAQPANDRAGAFMPEVSYGSPMAIQDGRQMPQSVQDACAVPKEAGMPENVTHVASLETAEIVRDVEVPVTEASQAYATDAPMAVTEKSVAPQASLPETPLIAGEAVGAEKPVYDFAGKVQPLPEQAKKAANLAPKATEDFSTTSNIPVAKVPDKTVNEVMVDGQPVVMPQANLDSSLAKQTVAENAAVIEAQPLAADTVDTAPMKQGVVEQAVPAKTIVEQPVVEQTVPAKAVVESYVTDVAIPDNAGQALDSVDTVFASEKTIQQQSKQAVSGEHAENIAVVNEPQAKVDVAEIETAPETVAPETKVVHDKAQVADVQERSSVTNKPAAGHATISVKKTRSISEQTAPGRIASDAQPVIAAMPNVAQPAAVDAPAVHAVAGVQSAAEARTAELTEAVEAVCAAMQVSHGITAGSGEIRLQLKPEVLDGTEIRLEAKGGELSVVFHAATESTGLLLEQNLPRLEQHLAQHIHAYQIAVSVKKEKYTNERV